MCLFYHRANARQLQAFLAIIALLDGYNKNKGNNFQKPMLQMIIINSFHKLVKIFINKAKKIAGLML